MKKFVVYLTYEFIVEAEDEDEALEMAEEEAPSGYLEAEIEEIC